MKHFLRIDYVNFGKTCSAFHARRSSHGAMISCDNYQQGQQGGSKNPSM